MDKDNNRPRPVASRLYIGSIRFLRSNLVELAGIEPASLARRFGVRLRLHRAAPLTNVPGAIQSFYCPRRHKHPFFSGCQIIKIKPTRPVGHGRGQSFGRNKEGGRAGNQRRIFGDCADSGKVKPAKRITPFSRGGPSQPRTLCIPRRRMNSWGRAFSTCVRAHTRPLDDKVYAPCHKAQKRNIDAVGSCRVSNTKCVNAPILGLSRILC